MANRIYCKVDFTDSLVSGAAAFDTPTWGNNFSATNASQLSKDTILQELLVVGGKYSRTMHYAKKNVRDSLRDGVVDNQGKLWIKGVQIDISLTIKAIDNAFIDNITIYFDKANGQYATKYIIDGETRTNDDNELALTFSSRQSLTITFLEWNRVGYNAVISYLGFDLDNKVFDKRWFKSIELTDQTMPLQAEPFFDVMSSQGTASFNDLNGELLDYATDGIFKPNLPFEIFVNDYKVANMQVNEWGDYEVQAKSVQAYLVDKLAKLDNTFSGMPLTENQNAYEVLRTICVPTIFATENDLISALQIKIQKENLPLGYTVSYEDKGYKYLVKLNKTFDKDVFVELKVFPTLTTEKIITIIIKAGTLETLSNIEYSEITPIIVLSYFAIYYGKKIIIGYGTNKKEQTIKAYLESISIQHAYLESASYRQSIAKIMSLAMLSAYTDNQGNILFKSARPRITAEQKANAIIIPPQAQMADWQETIQPKNEYKGVEYAEIKKYNQRNYNNNLNNTITPIFTFNSTLTSPPADIPTVTYSNNITITNQQFTSGDYDVETFGTTMLGRWYNFEGYFQFNETLSYSFNNNIFYVKTSNYEFGTRNEYIIFDEKTQWVSGDYKIYFVSDFSQFDNFNELNWGKLLIKADYSNNRMYFKGKILYKVTKKSDGSLVNWSSRRYFQLYNKPFDTEKEISIGNQKYKINSNKLLQIDTKINNQSIGEYLANATIEDYSTKNGIRTATVTLTGSVDYKNGNGDKVIIWNGDGTKPTILQKGDIVLPQSNKKDKNGKYLYQSTYKNGEPRYWEITGINHKYAGANRFVVELRENH